MDRILKKNLKALLDVVINEAEKNEDFAASLSQIFVGADKQEKTKSSDSGKKASNRRDKAVLDPIKLAEEGTLTREMLDVLSEKELKDIVAEFGMDPSKLAMKWKDMDRVVNLIMDTSLRRASKGDAFRA
ncbi:MAG: hypothetical protein ACK5LL_08320 [Suipraeoptans sp.]